MAKARTLQIVICTIILKSCLAAILRTVNNHDFEENKRQAFQPWGGKRSIVYKRQNFHPWGGKRSILHKSNIDADLWDSDDSGDQDSVVIDDANHTFKSTNTGTSELDDKRAFQPWGGKRAFQPWGGKRAFQPWGGKRAMFQPWGGKRAFQPWGGKRAFQPWGGKRDISSWAKRAFQPWGGKRNSDNLDKRAFQPWGGKRAFQPWGGKRNLDNNDKPVQEVLNLDNRLDEPLELLEREILQKTKDPLNIRITHSPKALQIER